MLEQTRNEVQECIKVFEEDANKCPNKETWLLLYDKSGTDLCAICKRYKSFELTCYVEGMMDALFAPTDATS